ncbi:hypothetical protein QR665_15295 [Acinetobacter gerneri]|uniref:hypothetical protein n=1 Tax=Acinetobacter gerneri TaxID=202952 RepID=UPI0029359C99|nr:hypothetical protein [Acinetobacter gerneri]MDV2440826.1 hypothetical protein [Acinetobacter gerneri]
MDIEKYRFIDGLKRKHANLIFGYNGNIYDRHLIGFITTEAAVFSPNAVSVRKIGNMWFVTSSLDWISHLCDDDSYLFKPNYMPDAGLFYHLSGTILAAFSNGVGLALDGKITISHHISERELETIQLEIDQLSGRTVFFKSVETYEKKL